MRRRSGFDRRGAQADDSGQLAGDGVQARVARPEECPDDEDVRLLGQDQERQRDDNYIHDGANDQ